MRRKHWVAIINTHRRFRMHKKPVVGYVRRVLEEEGCKRASITVVFIGSRACRRLNRQFLSHDYITDVISFGLEEGRALEGEIYVNLDRARQQARAYGVSLGNEVARLVIHGTLHLLGFDDQRSRDAEAMKAEEERHLAYWFR